MTLALPTNMAAGEPVRRTVLPGNWLLFYAVIYIVFLYLPVLLIPLFSFNDAKIVAFPLQGFTLRWYADLFRDRTLHDALWNSFVVAGLTAVISTTLATLVARAVTFHRFPGRGTILALIMSPLVLPEMILAIAFLIVIRQQFDLPLSLAAVIFGHVMVCTPYAVAVLTASFEGFDRSLEEASLDLGETMWSTFFRVTLPIITPGLISALLVTFTISLDEFIIAFFLSGTTQTLPVYIWGLLRFPNKLPIILALGSLLLLASFLLLFLAETVRRRAARHSGVLARSASDGAAS